MGSDGISFEVAVDVFYRELFKAVPASEQLFVDRHRQRSMFISALQSINDQSNDDHNLNNYLDMLGKKHIEMNITKEYMDAGKHAFDVAISEAGPNLTEGKKLQFQGAFVKLASAMGY
jgi:hemoglobin-like flavoprotein